MAQLRACEVRQLLHNKFVVVLGDSVQRAVYKDLVLLLQKDSLLSAGQLRAEGEPSFERDVLLAGGGGWRGGGGGRGRGRGGQWGRGRRVQPRGGRHDHGHRPHPHPHPHPPREVRQFRSGHHLVRFYLLARAFSAYVADVLEELRRGQPPPDLVIINSCLRDLARHGPGFRSGYREDLDGLFGLLDRVLPSSCLLVWTTAMPVARGVSTGSVHPPEHRHRHRHRRDAARLQDDVLEANFYSAAEASRRGFDVLDLHFHFRHAGQHLQPDGVHWDGLAHRHLSQLLLAHVADAWGVDLPCRCPVGRWLRDGAPPSGSPRRRAGGRGQHRGGRGDPGEQALSGPPARTTCLRSPRPSSASHAQAPRGRPSYRQDISVPSRPACDRWECARDPPARRVVFTGEADARSRHHEPRPGPVRRASTQHRSRWSPPPYPPRSPSGSRRHRQRHTDR